MAVLENLVSFLNTFCLLLLFVLLILIFMLLKHTDNTRNDFTDNQGNKLHVGKLEFKTKHGKKPNSFVKYVHPRDVKSAICLLVRLF